METCTTHISHSYCQQDDTASKTRPIATRLVQVSPALRLVDTRALPAGTNYRLEHCWGSKPIFRLTDRHEINCIKGFLWKSFPRISGTIELTRSFFDPIHMDRLSCIIQDSVEDWLQESMRMKDVYSNCFLNIAGTGSRMARGHLWPQKCEMLFRQFMLLQDTRVKFSTIAIRCFTVISSSSEPTGLVFQEQAYSSTLHLGENRSSALQYESAV